MAKSLVQMLKDLALRLNLIDDYVVERGSSGIWTYKKWASGDVDMWGTSPAYTVSVSTSWGYGYYCSNAVPPQNFPFEFKEVPDINFSPVQRGVAWFNLLTALDSPNTAPTTTATGSLVALRPNSHSNVVAAATFYVHGKLKAPSRVGGA